MVMEWQTFPGLLGLLMALYVARIVFFYFPHVVEVSALSICFVVCAFVVMNRTSWSGGRIMA